MVLLFDAANTLIHKPEIFETVYSILIREGYKVNKDSMIFNHKLLSEVIEFPDRTDDFFYQKFNRDWLVSLGIIPDEILLNDIFQACSYLPWVVFKDTEILKEISFKKAILSNFHGGLNKIIDNNFSNQFEFISISENEKLRKPDIVFFENAIGRLGVNPNEIIYIGDSIKLDLEPALKVGMNAWLIDRNNYFYSCKRRINSLNEITQLIQY